MAFDREHRVVVQYSATEFCSEPGTWTWNGGTWSQASGAQPSLRFCAGLAYDSARHQTVLYGGNDCQGSGPSDTWEWDGADWQQVATKGPGVRSTGPSLAYDRDLGKVVLFGGAGEHSNEMTDTWVWSGPTYRCDVLMAGDINCDGVVDIDDRKIVDTGQGHAACAPDDTRDLDGDGRITSADKAVLVGLCTYADCKRGAGEADQD